jgi:hypothetical protein
LIDNENVIYLCAGKTTFLNDTTKSHKCTYIRQYHNIRPYVTVSKIPNFDPSGLPYWEIYEREGKDSTIQVGGTMAGQFTGMLISILTKKKKIFTQIHSISRTYLPS